MKIARIAVLLGPLLVLSGCAAGTNDADQAAAGGLVAQLVLGFWHGVIAPVTLLVEVVRRFLPGLVPWPWHLFQSGLSSVPYDIGFYFGITSGPTVFLSRRRR